MTEPLGKGKNGKDVWIGDIWPSSEEVHALMRFAMDPDAFESNYGKVKADLAITGGVHSANEVDTYVMAAFSRQFQTLAGVGSRQV